MKNIFKKLLPRQKPARKPSPLLLEMEAVNENLTQIAALLASQKPPTVVVNTQTSTAETSDFEPFTPFAEETEA